jgi:ERCC4-type nuclease
MLMVKAMEEEKVLNLCIERKEMKDLNRSITTGARMYCGLQRIEIQLYKLNDNGVRTKESNAFGRPRGHHSLFL